MPQSYYDTERNLLQNHGKGLHYSETIFTRRATVSLHCRSAIKRVNMKQNLLFIFLAGMMLVSGGCKKNNDKPAVLILSTDRLVGLWVPYESIWSDGVVFTGALTASSIFGSYDESVQINKDHSFIPVVFFDKDNIKYSIEEKGTYSFTPFGKLEMNGSWKFEFTIERLNADEMWLKTSQTQNLYKFRKQP